MSEQKQCKRKSHYENNYYADWRRQKRQKEYPNALKYNGVYKAGTKGRVQARIKFRGKSYYLGVFNDARKAAIAVDFKMVKLGLAQKLLNFPDDFEMYKLAADNAVATAPAPDSAAASASSPAAASTSKSASLSASKATVASTTNYDAASAFDSAPGAVDSASVPALLPHIPVAPKPDYSFGKFGPRPHKNKYRGVSIHKRVHKKSYYISIGSPCFGSFEREEDAARAYDLAAVCLGRGPEWLNFPAEIETRREEHAAAQSGSSNTLHNRILRFVNDCLHRGNVRRCYTDEKGLKTHVNGADADGTFIASLDKRCNKRLKTENMVQDTPQRHPSRKRQTSSKFRDFLFDQTGQADQFTSFTRGRGRSGPGQFQHVAHLEDADSTITNTGSSSGANIYGDGPPPLAPIVPAPAVSASLSAAAPPLSPDSESHKGGPAKAPSFSYSGWTQL